MILGKQLRYYRIVRKMTQPELAEKLGIALRTLQCYEQGVREPRLEIIVKIADILDITTDELLGRNIEK